MKIINIIICLNLSIIIACATIQRKDNIFGVWVTEHVYNEGNNVHQSVLTIEYSVDGTAFLYGGGIMRAGNKKAEYRFEGHSYWNIEKNFYYERIIDFNLIKVDGDKELPDLLIKELIGDNRSYSEWKKWKIVKLTKQNFIISKKKESDEDAADVVLELKKL
jgi:hypothetical protein